jgi:hypothetical protein
MDWLQKTLTTLFQELDEGNGELPLELNAILESIEAKPIGTELDDGEPWSEKGKAQNNVGPKPPSFFLLCASSA